MAEFSVEAITGYLCEAAEKRHRKADRAVGILNTLVIGLAIAFAVALVVVLYLLLNSADNAAIIGTGVATVASGAAAVFVTTQKNEFTTEAKEALAKLQELQKDGLCPVGS